MSPKFKEFLATKGDELCALRLMPLDSSLPKLRMRWYTAKKVLTEWFSKQEIDCSKYKAEFVPHATDYRWSTIFIVNNKGIFGEIIKGGHYQLTQGFYGESKPISFSYNFDEWKLNVSDKEAKKHLQEVVSKIFVKNYGNQEMLKENLNATFSNDFLCGYFETVFSETHGLWFCDYNRIIGEMYKDFQCEVDSICKEGVINGMPASKGLVRGRVRLIRVSDLENVEFNQNEILVCDMTSPDFVPLMQKAAAIITDRRGILSHAAIVSRELGIPCITGTRSATTTLSDGDMVEIDGEKGIVRKLVR